MLDTGAFCHTVGTVPKSRYEKEKNHEPKAKLIP
jgi:hypothetical protein